MLFHIDLFFHIEYIPNWLAMIMYGQLQIGNAMVSMERFELEKALAAVERYRVSHHWAEARTWVSIGGS